MNHAPQQYTFERHGFVVLRSVFSQDKLKAMRLLLDSLVAYSEQGFSDPFEQYYLRHRYDQGVLYDLYQRHPEFNEFARNEKILNAVEEAIGANFFIYENSLVYKPSGKKNGVPFHQDFISRPHEPIKFIAWMAIDRVTKNSGALKVIPGSHKGGFRKWHRVKGETHHDRIDMQDVEIDDVVHIELNPGDVLVFNQLVIHGSDEMNTDSQRYVYRVSYQNFDEIFTPRGTPIVVRGARPEQLVKIFNTPRSRTPKKLAITAFINKIGNRLAKL
jgi:phytanoyl-CoA hydroxylase